jgi:hypothetical protein
VIKVLHDASKGQLRPLYENLRKVAIWKVDYSQAQINPQNISKALGSSQGLISTL